MEEKKIVNVSKSVSYPSDWWDRFAEAAKKERLSVTAWIGMACRNFLPDDVACKLSPKNKSGRKPLTEKQKTTCRGCLTKPREDGEIYCRECFKKSPKYKKLLAGYIKAVNESQAAKNQRTNVSSNCGAKTKKEILDWVATFRNQTANP